MLKLLYLKEKKGNAGGSLIVFLIIPFCGKLSHFGFLPKRRQSKAVKVGQTDYHKDFLCTVLSSTFFDSKKGH